MSTGFDWLALVKSGITSGIKGAVSDSAEYALSWGLDSMFGLEVGKAGKQEEKQQLISSLQDISGELTQIDQNLTVISAELATLTSTINEDFQKTLAAIAVTKVNSAKSSIESFWQTLKQDMANAISNQNLDQPVPSGQSGKFATQVLTPGTGGVQYEIDQIFNSMYGSQSSPGLLDTWTTTLIQQVQGGMPLTQAYQWLENNFLQSINAVFVGSSLMVMATVRNAWVAGNPAASQTAAQNDANNFLATLTATSTGKNSAPNLRSVTRFFVQSVHRLILSQYMVPNAQNNGFIPFVSQADADAMLTRANLVAWLILREPTDPPNPGLIVTNYYRPSQIKNGKAPALQPGTAYPASSGEIVVLDGPYQSNWYKVIDFSDAACTQLLDYADSNIVIVNYNWPTPAPTAGKPVGTGPFANVIAQHYDTTTLNVVAKPSASEMATLRQEASALPPAQRTQDREILSTQSVIYAFASDMSAITDNLAWSNSWQMQGSQNTTTGKNGSLHYGLTSSVTSQPRTLNATLTVSGQYKDDAMSFTNSLVRPFTYSSTPNPSNATNPTMRVLAAAAVQASASAGGAPPGDSPIPVSIATSLQFPAKATVSGSAISLSNPSSRNPPNTGSWTWNAFESLSVSPGEDLTLTFQITSATAKQGFGDFGGANFPSQTKGSWTVSGLTLAWSQPAP